MYDPDSSDPDRRYKGFLYQKGLQPIVSPDGVHWQFLDVPEIPSADEANLSYDHLTDTFIATAKQGGPYGRAVTLSTSKDFETWTKPELVFHADELDQDIGAARIRARAANPEISGPLTNNPDYYNVDVYNMGVFRYEGIYVGLPAMYHSTGPSADGTNTDGFHLVELACSRDLKNWPEYNLVLARNGAIEVSFWNANARLITIRPRSLSLRSEKPSPHATTRGGVQDIIYRSGVESGIAAGWGGVK